MTAISLLLLFWVPFIGTYTGLQWEKYQHKRAIKWRILRGMDKEYLTLLKFPQKAQPQTLRWKDDREFEFKGRMYDVVERQQTGDTIVYWCWQDHAETALNRKLEEAVAQASGQIPSDQNQKEHLQHFLKSLYCTEWPWPETDFVRLPAVAGFSSPAMLYTSASHGPPPPPPWAG